MRRFSDFPIFWRLVTAFLAVLLVLFVVGLLGIYGMERIGRLADQLYNHPFTVGTTIRDLRTDADHMHAALEGTLRQSDAVQLAEARRVVAVERGEIDESLERVAERYLGPAADVVELRRLLTAWTEIQKEILAIDAPVRSPTESAALLREEREQHRAVATAIERIVSFSNRKALELRNRGQEVIAETTRHWMLVLGGLGLFLGLLAWRITRNLTVPLGRLCTAMRDLSAGRLHVAVPYCDNRSEIGTIARTLAEFQGTALRMEERSWLDGHMAAIALELQAQPNLTALGRALLGRLLPLLPAGRGVLYARRGEDWPQVAALGFVGTEQPAVILAPEDIPPVAETRFPTVEKGGGLRLTVAVRGHAVAVLILDMVEPLSPRAGELLVRILHLLGLNVEGLRRQEQAEALLAHTSELAWELQARADALQASEEKLRISNTELTQQTAVLADQQQQVELAWSEANMKAREADLANRHKSEFLANMSHEIRTPLNAILGLAYLLEKTPLNADQSDQVGKITLAGRSLLSIVNDVLDFSRIEAGRLDLEKEPFRLGGVIDAIAAITAVNAGSKSLAFQVAMADDVPPVLVGDGFRLQQVLMNLTGNAVKFTEQGSVRLEVRVAERASGRAVLCFTIRDTGIGIPAETLPFLFHAFTQADTTTTRRYGGSGLGLVISKRLVELMGGSITVDSTVGQGSRFVVEIPFAVSESAVAPLPPEVAHHDCGMAPLSGLRILLVEDNPINRQVASRILEDKGAQVMCEADGKAAVERIGQDPAAFDVVLMDIQMPVMDGYEATRRLKQGLGLSALPVIALTAGALPSEREKAVESGMDGFISKPFEVDVLVDTVARFAPALADG